MHAFGLEENNRYDLAQEAGEAALALDRRDPWAVHAVAHVHEMQGRFDEGSAWLRDRVDDWSPENGFAFHNWWHLALFQLERGDTAAAVSLLDERVVPGAELALQRVDITALMWRLRLMGVDLGSRWDANADAWLSRRQEAGFYAFNDLHAAVAQIGAGRLDAVPDLISAVRPFEPVQQLRDCLLAGRTAAAQGDTEACTRRTSRSTSVRSTGVRRGPGRRISAHRMAPRRRRTSLRTATPHWL